MPKCDFNKVSIHAEVWVALQLYWNRTAAWVFSCKFAACFQDGCLCNFYFSEAYSETCQASNMEYFAKMVNGLNLLAVFAKCSILDVWKGSEYVFVKFYFLTSYCDHTQLPGSFCLKETGTILPLGE